MVIKHWKQALLCDMYIVFTVSLTIVIIYYCFVN